MNRATLIVSMWFLGCGSSEATTGADGTASEADGLSFRWVAPSSWNVSGAYDLTFSNQVTVKLDVGGAHREVTAQGYGGIVNFGTINGAPTVIDLKAFCAKPEVVCPSEASPKRVNVIEQNLSSNWSARPIAVSSASGASVSGWVDHDTENFVLGLGGQSGSGTNCAALGLSLAGGRFTRAPSGGAVNGIAAGRIAVGFAGLCALGPLLAGATVSLETQFTGTKAR